MAAFGIWTCLWFVAIIELGLAGPKKYKFFRKTAQGTLHELEEVCSQPCQNGGQCYKERCVCPPDYVGQFCQFQRDGVCSPPCQNGGQCRKGRCLCPPDYMGESCELKREEVCSPPCQNGGQCHKGRCLCLPDYMGEFCEIQREEVCSPPCQNGGQCRKGRCVCPPDYMGEFCDFHRDEVCSQPCQNGGECRRGLCVCPSNYKGHFCEFPVDLCDLKGAGFRGESKCTRNQLGTTCVLECTRGWSYVSLPLTNVYNCTPDGQWSPRELPKCVEKKADNQVKTLAAGFKRPSGTCAVWGRGHYRTFDGSLFSFRSRCRHLLTHECRGDTFSVHVSDRHCDDTSTSKGPCRRTVQVYVEGQRYDFQVEPAPKVRLGNVSAPLPTTLEGLRVDYVAGRVIVHSQLGFTVVWDGRDSVEVSVEESLKGSMCGLCGQYDGDPSNDFVNSHGRQVTSRSAFLDSWKKDDLGEECEDIFFDPSIQHHSEELVLEARRLCSRVTNETFASCHKLVDPTPYSNMCLEDYVSCMGDHGEGCRCSALAEYFRECTRLGGSLEATWRRDDFCPARCPAGRVYSQCGASCVKTCRDPEPTCQSDRCVDGCHCPEKTLLHNGLCLRPQQCPCLLHGREYRAGSLVKRECNSCECRGGEWQCTTNQCPSRCVANGDPFYSTFDGKTYEFSGQCPYYLLHSKNFSVIQELGHCPSDTAAAVKESVGSAKDCYKSVTVASGKDVVVIERGKVMVNTYQVQLPYSSPEVIVYSASSEITRAEFPNGVVLLWDQHSRLHIDSPPGLQGQFQGLCGSNNLNQKDDFWTPTGDVEVEVGPFTQKWKVDDSCAELEALEKHPCERAPQRVSGAKRLCKELYADYFRECHYIVDPEPYYKMCLHRTCACDKPLKDCVCPTYSEYAAECTRKGRITQWRQHIPPCGVDCPKDMAWSECVREKSCFEIALGDSANQTCVEGCACVSGYKEDGACVPIDDCSCLHDHRLHSAGATKKIDGQSCECDNGEWDCSDEDEDEDEDGKPDSTPPKIDANGASSERCSHDENAEYTTCLDGCPRTCDNMNAQTTCDAVACMPGCRCKTGFVLEKASNSCVPESQCGCKHGGKTYQVGTEIRRDCNKCTCRGGRWECEKSQCPGVCTVWGDSHFSTFDGRIFDFRGECESMLAKGRLDKDKHFEVSFQSVPCAAGDTICKRTIRIRVPGVSGSEEVMILGGAKPLPAVRFGGGYIVRETTLQVTVFTNLGVVIQWDKATRASIIVQPSWKGRVKGLCGNFDGNQMDDFQTPSGGMVEGDARVFGDSWKLRETCPATKEPEDLCEENLHRKTWAVQKCEVLKSKLFEPCHSEVSLEPYYERCVQDVCGCDSGGDCECLCTNVAAYAHECGAQGVPVKWRSQALCPIQCDSECSEYDACMPGCPPKTCETLSVTTRLEEVCSNGTLCEEGCRPKPCPPGFVFDNERDMNCVHETHCKVPCKEIHGELYLEGERIVDERIAEPCESCFCQSGSIVCKGHPCPNTERPPTVECSSSGWTPWLNPPAKASGDFALLGDLKFASLYSGYCGPQSVVDIECRVASTGVDVMKAGQSVTCQLPRGLACYHREQAGGTSCLDYEVRLLCGCDASVNEITPTTDRSRMGGDSPKTTTATYTNYVNDNKQQTTTALDDGGHVPTEGPLVICVPHWTDFYNTDSPDIGDGDVEVLEDIKRDYVVCDGAPIEDVQCRATVDGKFVDYRETGDVGVKCSKVTGLVCLNWLQPKGRVCKDYAVRFLCQCAGTREPDDESETGPTDVASCLPGWSPFFDFDHPSSGEGDVESPEYYQERSCSGRHVKKIECKVFDNKTGTVTDWTQTVDSYVTCSREEGLVCLNDYQGPGKICHNYKIRVFCVCPGQVTRPPTVGYTELEVTSPPSELTTSSESPAPAEPEPRDQGRSPTCGWTEWMDVDDPMASTRDMGDFESLDVLMARYDTCALESIEGIECRVKFTHEDWTESGQSSLSCDIRNGFRCYNKHQTRTRCHDYEVRLLCSCPEGENRTTAVPPSTVVTEEQTVNTESESTTEPSASTESQGCSWYNPFCPRGPKETTTTEEPDTSTSRSSTLPPDTETEFPETTSSPESEVTMTPIESITPTVSTPYSAVYTTTGSGRFNGACPPGQVYASCAYQCNQTCNSFRVQLYRQGKCLEADDCLPGCRPEAVCEHPRVWHDYLTCIEVEECSCLYKGKVMGANQVIDEGCERCICQDNIVICSDLPGCRTLPTGLPLLTIPGQDVTVIMENVTLPLVTCVPGWTPWYNTRKPDTTGDFETIDAIRADGHFVCDEPYRTDIQCKVPLEAIAANKSPVPPQEVECDLAKGLYCFNEAQRDRRCLDHAVRFYCDCRASRASGTTPVSIDVATRMGRGYDHTIVATTTVTASVTTPKDYGSTAVTSTEYTTPTAAVYKPTTVETTSDECKRFVYLVNGPLPLPASSYKASSSASPASGPNHSRLGAMTSQTSLGAWIPRRQGPGEFVEVDLGRVRTLFGVTTQGRERTREWVKSYRVLLSADGTQYAYIQGEDGQVKDFLGNHDSSGVMRQLFERPVRARFVRIEPTTWNGVIALRFDVLGCVDGPQNHEVLHPPVTDAVPGTPGTPETATTFVSMCPEIPEDLAHFCPSCPEGYLCDGSECVLESRCPCFHDGHLFHVNTIVKTKDCNTCTCSLHGHSKCTRTKCRCGLGKRSGFDVDCNCKCEFCPSGQRLCQTSNECIDELKWCNGVKDCPDDEQDCEDVPQRHPPAISPCPTAKKPSCPKGRYPKLDRDARCPEYVCVPEDEDLCKVLANAGTCMIAGNSVKTFDGQEFRYEICDHVLLQDKKSKQFSVTAHKRCHKRGDINVCEKSVSIMCNEVFVKLGPTLQEVKVNGADVPTRSLQTISRRLQDVHLALSGQRLLFASQKHNFQVTLDQRQNIKIGVSECLSETTSGLCGSFNYVRTDDFRTPDGRLETSSQVFGDSWATTAKTSCSPSSCPRDVRERARQWCHKLKEAPLSQCLEASSTSMSMSICEDFVCECMAYSDDDAKKCMCQAIEGFVSTCDASVRQKIASEWRLLLGCAPKCPAGMEWRDCGPACEKTCENMRDKSNDCSEDCVTGCFCPMGLVRRGDSCVPPEFCHDCVCRGHGDPNYITFDGRYYDFQGTCSYVLAQHVSGDAHLDFQVLGKNAECPEEPRTTCTQGLAISYRSHHVRITRGQRVNFNDYDLQDKDYPWDKKGFNISWVPGRSTVVYIPEISLVVRYFELNYGFSIELPSFTYFNETEGLCGVCNFDETDDLLHKDGRASTDVASFAYSWIVEGTPETCKIQAAASKRSVPREICQFERNACDLYVDPDLYQKSCLNDAGYTRNLSASVCRSKLQYAEHCCSQGGVSVHRWLQDSGCDSGCPRNMELRCDSGCPKTCANYRNPNEVCPLAPSYACFCKDGFVLKNGECVATKNCEACDDEGHLIGDTWQVSPCETCQCGENLKVRCTSIRCPAPPQCRNDEKLIHLPRSNETCCDNYLCDANLLSSCKPPPPVVCQPGAVSRLKVNDEGCPSYFCECDLKQCPSLQWPANLEQGLEAFVELQGCCNKVSVRCNPQRCQDMPNCPPNTELQNEPGECCTTYKCVPKNKCTYIHQYKVVNGMQIKLHSTQQYEKMYPPDSSWSDGLCTNCSCSQRFNQYHHSCRVEVCPGEQQDAEDYEYTVDTRASGVCCPKQRRTACRGGGLVYKIGSQWTLPGEEKCRTYRCEESPTTGEAVKAVLTQICNKTCLRSERYVEPQPGSNDCCGRCVREFCEENHNLYQVGETWISTLRPCFSVQCVRGESGAVETKYILKACPKLPSNCPKNNIVRDETGCCQKCQVTPGSCRPQKLDASKSLQFFTLDDRVRGFCSNSEPIQDLQVCKGQCNSSTIFSSETNDFTSSCTCCTIKTAVQKTVTLTCADGSKIQKQYKNPTSCTCSPCGEQGKPTSPIREPTPL